MREADLPYQNFVMTTPAALALSGRKQGASLNLGWFGINGVSYQPLCSTNLVDWWPYDVPQLGANGPMGLAVPLDSAPTMFFRFSTSY
jgi:hypothetical protein